MMIALGVWIAVFVALLIAYAYRKMVGSNADELVHLSDVSDSVIAKQESMAGKLQQLDRVVRTLAIVFVVYGVVLGSYEIYTALS